LTPNQVDAIKTEETMHVEHIRRIWEKYRNALTQKRRCEYKSTRVNWRALLFQQSLEFETVGKVQSAEKCKERAKALKEAIYARFNRSVAAMDRFFDSQAKRYDAEAKDASNSATHEWIDALEPSDWSCKDT
jgi:hypothetical protein